MRSRTLAEVREVLRSPWFRAWHARYVDVVDRLRSLRARGDALKLEAQLHGFHADALQQQGEEDVFQAGAIEELVGRAEAELAEVENESFEALGAFEIQREASGAALARWHRAEKELEDARQRKSELEAELQARRRKGALDMHALTPQVQEAERQVAACIEASTAERTHLTDEEGRRDRLWEDVQDSWSRSFRASMARTEYAYQARCRQAEVKRLFVEADERRKRIAVAEQEAREVGQQTQATEAELESLLEEGRRRFDCALVREFMYWLRADDVRGAFCVPLIDVGDCLNMQLVALDVYQVERNRGLDLVEPVFEQDTTGDDERLQRFFVEGRPVGPRRSG